MIRIAICDDEELICSYIEEIILKYANNNLEKVEIDIFTSGQRLIEELKRKTEYDMLFLDIDLKSESGIHTGKKIRDSLKNEKLHIIYISGNSSYAMDLFEIRPIQFLIKPLKEEQIISIYNKSKKISNKIQPMFKYKQNRKFIKRPIQEILYFESMDRKVRIVHNEGEEIFYGTLKEISDEIGEYGFISCHKSYLINYGHVTQFEYERVTMSNEEVLPISQPQRKFVREYQLKYERSHKE